MEASYVSYEYHDSTGRKVAQKDDLICECPKFAAYADLSTTQWTKGDITAKVTSYSCAKVREMRSNHNKERQRLCDKL